MPALPSSVLEPLWIQFAALLPVRHIHHPWVATDGASPTGWCLTSSSRSWCSAAATWGNQYGKLRWCTERRRVVVEFWLALAAAAIVCGRLVRRAWTSYRWDGRPRRRP